MDERQQRIQRSKKRRKRRRGRKKRRILWLVFLLLVVAVTVGVGIWWFTRDTSLEDGTKALEDKKYSEAIEYYEKAIAGERQPDEAYRGEGIAYFEQKDYIKAQEAFQKAIDNGADANGTLYNFLGLCQMNQQQYQDAITSFESGLTAGGSDKLEREMHYNVVVCYEQLKDWENAKVKAAEYVQSYPDDEQMARENEFLQTR